MSSHYDIQVKRLPPMVHMAARSLGQESVSLEVIALETYTAN